MMAILGLFQQQSDMGLTFAAGMTAETHTRNNVDEQQHADKQNRQKSPEHIFYFNSQRKEKHSIFANMH